MDDLILNSYEGLILDFRGYKVMVDADIASLYNTETKKLKQAVKRNLDRFPSDFMFELTKEEKNSLLDSVERLASLKFSSVNPMVFTEQGVAMLSSVINNERAIKINIEIMRAFSRYRTLVIQNNILRKEIESVEDKLNQAFNILLEKIDQLSYANSERRRIGYIREDI